MVRGSHYDSKRLVREMVRHLVGRLKGQLPPSNHGSRKGRVLCSDAIAHFLLAMGCEEFQRPADWTPAAMLSHLMEHSDFEQVRLDWSLTDLSIVQSAGGRAACDEAAPSARPHLSLVRQV